MKRLSLLLFIALLSFGSVHAQKFGHLNLGTLIAEMPETKTADTQITAYAQQLQKEGENMITAFQAEYEKAVQDLQAGKLAPVDQQNLQQDLQKKEAEIRGYDAQMQQRVAIKRQELLAPILQKATDAINAVAKEQGYTMIFDTSVFNAILFTQESDDVMAPVKIKLGM